MLEQIAAYLQNIGYTVEEQGKIEKYLVVFQDGHPIGFVLSDLSVKLVSDTKDQEGLSKIVEFVRDNQNLQTVGKGEYVLINFCGHLLTTFIDRKEMKVEYAAYIRDDSTGEVHNTVFIDHDEAVYRFIAQTQMIDLKAFMPIKQSIRERLRSRLIQYLLSKPTSKAEQSKAAPPYYFKGSD